MKKTVVVIDNYDSFTFNLVQYLEELGAAVSVFRNDKISVASIQKMKPGHIVISPGPCTPKQAGISNEVIRKLHRSIPILGVCLGHQCIGHVFGGIVTYAPELMHGKTSAINHTGAGILRNLPSPFTATRYHSLVVSEKRFPACLEVTAYDDHQVIMALRHRDYPVFGVQFHPESILTEHGKALLKNFLES